MNFICRNGFQKLDKIKDTSRQSRQLDDLTDKMRECKRYLIIASFNLLCILWLWPLECFSQLISNARSSSTFVNSDTPGSCFCWGAQHLPSSNRGAHYYTIKYKGIVAPSPISSCFSCSG